MSQIARSFRQLLLENYQLIRQLSYETTLLSESEVKTLKIDEVTRQTYDMIPGKGSLRWVETYGKILVTGDFKTVFVYDVST
jgi:hypothetical protein